MLSEIIEVEGLVYVLSNPVMPGLLKIGFTTRTIDERLDELASATGVPASFQLEALFDVDEPQAVERAVHAELAEHRLTDNREFFRCGIEAAIAVIEKHAGAAPILRATASTRNGSAAGRTEGSTGRTRHVVQKRLRQLRCPCGHTTTVGLAEWETHWRCGNCQQLQPVR